jgi:outer membrane immunogenic protein
MKTSFVAVFMLGLLAMAGFAGAADTAGTGHNWTGFYIGVNAGAAFNDSDYTLRPNKGYQANTPAQNSLISGSGDFNDTSFTGGAQAGYNYQMSFFVLGLETDFNYNGIDESDHVARAFGGGRFIHTVTQEVDYFGTLRARVGFTPIDTLLVYATGGLAYGSVDSNSNVLFTAPVRDNYIGSKSSLRTGWTAGGGIEYALSRNWSIRAEYLGVDLGSQSYEYGNQAVCSGQCSYRTGIDTFENIARLGINYKF